MRPIGFALDDRGRLWVAEAHTYPVRAAEGQGQGPHPDLRRHQRRRAPRQPESLHREPESRQRHRSRLRRRVGRRGAVSDVHSGQGGNGPSGRSAADPARRLGLSGHARDAQHVHVGPRRVALRNARRLHPLERRQARRTGLRAPAAERRDLALSSDEARLRGLRRGHQQSVGARLQRLRSRVHDRVRHRAPVSRRPGREIQAAGRQALQPVRLRRHQDRRRSRALGRAPGTARRQQPIGFGRRRPCARGRDDLPRRRHLARASIASRSS